jgi:NDP-sugar pyrophosphorylase family protein
MIKDIDVLILCGGAGSRLKKISGRVPKPMVRIGKLPFLDILIGYLKEQGFKRFILGLGYGAQYIKRYYSKHNIPGIEIKFSSEARPLGTGGAVKNAKRFIKSKIFLVLNGDSFSEFNADDLVAFYKQKKAGSLILLRKVKNSRDFGAVITGRGAEIVSFAEKNSKMLTSFVNGGIYLFSKSIFSVMPKKAMFSLEYDLFPQLIGKRLYGYKKAGFFIDIGTPKRYFAAKTYFLNNEDQ